MAEVARYEHVFLHIITGIHVGTIHVSMSHLVSTVVGHL